MHPALIAIGKAAGQALLRAGVAARNQSHSGGGYHGGMAGTGNTQVEGNFHRMALAAAAAVHPLAALGVAAASIPGKIERMGNSLIAGQSGHQAYNARFANALASLEVDRFRRNVRMAQNTSGTFSMLANSQSGLEKSLQPIKELVQNLNNVAQVGANNAAQAAVDQLSKWDAANGGVGGAIASTLRLAFNILNGPRQDPLSVQLINQLADGITDRRREPPIEP